MAGERGRGDAFCVPARAVLALCVRGWRVGLALEGMRLERSRGDSPSRPGGGGCPDCSIGVVIRFRGTRALLGSDASAREHGTGKQSGSVVGSGTVRSGLNGGIQEQSGAGPNRLVCRRPDTKRECA